MIEEIKDIKLIENLFKKYKEKYNPIINDYTFILSYKENNKYVGFIIYQVLYEKAEIIDIFVLDEYRNRGIGKALINKMLENKEIESVTLEVKNDNKLAIMLYNSLGFKEVSIRKGYYNGVDALLMLKEVK
ncbi:MAG: ribosomal protein S18-alanine N-acetyltransferase [Bacilli bacterium]|nr:ribosomal protein S18-alanine N-acetyltransferase [Bacilli bacterium]